MIKKLLKTDDNVLSFLCGIFSNIPLSILFTINKYGTTKLEHIYFFLWIITFFVSISLACCAVIFTSRKIKIQKELDKMAPIDRANAFNTLYEKNKKFLSVIFLLFFIAFIILIILIISLWVIANFIKI